VVIGVIALALCFAINNTPSANTAIPVFSILVIITTTLFLLFSEKVNEVNFKGKTEKWDVGNIRMRKTPKKTSATNQTMSDDNISINWTSKESKGEYPLEESNNKGKSIVSLNESGIKPKASDGEGRRRRKEELEPESDSDTLTLESSQS